MERANRKTISKFIFPSALGILLFMVPVPYKEQSSLVIGIIVEHLQALLVDVLPTLIVIIIVISVSISLWHRLQPIGLIQRSSKLTDIFVTSDFNLVVKVVGAILAVMVRLNFGPEIICSPETGEEILINILPTCGIWFFVAGLLLPLITDYGIMDLLSTVLKNIARPLFKVPGRALIDCFTSWMGSGVCGAYLTISQYESGCYTAREAAVIVTNFSIVSIGFCASISELIGVYSAFTYYYFIVVVAGLLCAIITPRLWPLNKFPDTYDEKAGKNVIETAPEGYSRLKWGFKLAVERAEKAPGLKEFFIKGVATAINLVVNTAPILMAFGTIALILTSRTPLFDIVAYPFRLLLEALNMPYAVEAAPTMIIGFVDAYLPVIIGAGIPSFYTRFVIGCLAVLQIIYITEIGTLLLTSRVPIKLWQLFVIFMERTFICLPVIMIFAHIFSIGG